MKHLALRLLAWVTLPYIIWSLSREEDPFKRGGL